MPMETSSGNIRPMDGLMVIVNPNAGTGRGRKDWEQIAFLLRHYNLPFDFRFSEGKGHTITIAREAIENGYRRIVTVGGDGTLNEALNGVYLNTACKPDQVSMGVIPVGTGNDWGRMFGVPADYAAAVRIIAENKTLLHDVGVITYTERDQEKTRFFINIAGFGFESAVVKRTNLQKEKGRGGKLIYLIALVTTLFSYRNARTYLTIDTQEISTDIFSINIGNGRFCGGGMRQTPEALPDDGYLDVTVIKNMGKLEIIRNLKILYNGKILEHSKITGYRCREIRISSDKQIWAEADGETLGHTPSRITLLPGAINMIYGTRLIP
jgi:YegS/Rv2252/BmrU family lipid kinase